MEDIMRIGIDLRWVLDTYSRKAPQEVEQATALPDIYPFPYAWRQR